MYMRLLGYPAEKITVLTTYNGQKHLLRDVIQQRCATNPFIGRPAKVTTVDKFQGQQNDYILLSLVRTKTVGHIRDIRRLTVAMSRARLGMIVFARESLFSSCYELQRTFSMLTARPQSLQLIPGEKFFDPSEKLLNRSKINPKDSQIRSIGTMPEMVQFVFEYYQQVVTLMQAEQPEEFKRIMSGGAIAPAQEPEEQGGQNVEDSTENVAEDEEMPFEPLGEDDQGMDDEIELPSDEEDITN